MNTTRIFASLLLVAPLLVAPQPAAAVDLQEEARTMMVASTDATSATTASDAPAPADDRWLPWHGCWQAADDSGSESDAGLLVCFDPLPDASGVQIRTLVDGEVLALERIVADGNPVPAEDGGCSGERVAEWSNDGSRAFISSSLRCAEGVTRSTTGVMALARNGTEWIEIHSVRVGNGEEIVGMRVFEPASDATVRAQGVQPPAGDRQTAVRTARTMVSSPLGPDDVLEVSEKVGSGVARALVSEVGQPFNLNARTMQALTRQGLPGEVLDVMVAVTYPERFEVESGVWQAERAAPQQVVSARDGRPTTTWPDRSGYHGAYDPVFSPESSGWFYWTMAFLPRSSLYRYTFIQTAWGPMWVPAMGRGSWGYGGFGSPYISRPGGIVLRDRQARVNPLTGYSTNAPTTRSASGGTAANSQPNTRTIGTNRIPTPTATRGVSSSTGHSAGSAGSSSGSSSGTGRQAIPRTQAGGGGG
jgi:hypothetical protein